MKRNLQEENRQWQQMPRNNDKELAAADMFFDEVLMPLAQQEFIKKYDKTELPKYEGMVLTLGTSWQPLALSISVLKPKFIKIIMTAETKSNLVKLVQFLNLPDNCYSAVEVERSECLKIYQEIKKFHEEHAETGRLCLDITGGTKAMASSAAMIGAVLKLDIYYVESKYLPLYRRPEAGSERLEVLPLPRL